MGKIVIAKTGDMIGTSKDYRGMDLAEVGAFMTEVEVIKKELLEKFIELRDKEGMNITKTSEG